MSESSPQLASLLAPSLQGVLQGLPGGLSAGQSRAAGVGNEGFQQQLQDILAQLRDQPGNEPLSGQWHPGGPAASLASTQPVKALPEAGAGTAAASGNSLPFPGNSLPPSVATASVMSVTSSPEINVDADGGQLPGDQQQGLNPTALNRLQSLLQTRTAVTASGSAEVQVAELPPAAEESLSEMQRRLAELPGLSAGNAVDKAAGKTAALSSLLPPASPVVELARQLNLQRPAGSGVRPDALNAMDADLLAESGEISGARAESARVHALADSTAAQFNLHARGSDALLQPATPGLTAEAALRDLQNMTPLRPQNGGAEHSWSSGLGQRMLMMVENGIETARLRLSPANLGPLDIHVSIEDDQAKVWFGAQHSATREALELALPRLRELFAEQGLQLAQADVGEHGQREKSARSDTAETRLPARAVADGRLEASVPDISEPAWTAGDSHISLDIYV